MQEEKGPLHHVILRRSNGTPIARSDAKLDCFGDMSADFRNPSEDIGMYTLHDACSREIERVVCDPPIVTNHLGWFRVSLEPSGERVYVVYGG